MPNSFDESKKEVESYIKALHAKSKKIFNVTVPAFDIKYNLRGVNIYGEMHYSKRVMRLNKHLLLECGKRYIEDVVTHEFAHFIADTIHPEGINRHSKQKIQIHGKEFMEILRTLHGYDINNYHYGDYTDTKYIQNEKKKLAKRRNTKALIEDVESNPAFGTFDFKPKFEKRHRDEIIYGLELLCQEVHFVLDEKVIDSNEAFFTEDEMNELIKALKNQTTIKSKYFTLVLDEIENAMGKFEYESFGSARNRLLETQIELQ